MPIAAEEVEQALEVVETWIKATIKSAMPKPIMQSTQEDPEDKLDTARKELARLILKARE